MNTRKILLIILVFILFSNVIYAEEKSFRVCAYNVGNFSLGLKGYGTGTDSIYNNMSALFNRTNADVYLFSEWDMYFNKDENVLSKDKFSNLGYNFSTESYAYIDPSNYNGQMNMFKKNSKYELMHYYNTDSNVQSTLDYLASLGVTGVKDTGRGYLDNVITINNHDIHFISTHLSWNYKILRSAEIDSLINYIKSNNIEYFVIGGDFNMGYDSNNENNSQRNEINSIMETIIDDINKFTDEGYISIEGNKDFGDSVYTSSRDSKDYYFLNTYYDNSLKASVPIDNVVYSPNLVATKAYTDGDRNSSDHSALIVDFTFVDETPIPGEDFSFTHYTTNYTNMIVDKIEPKTTISTYNKYFVGGNNYVLEVDLNGKQYIYTGSKTRIIYNNSVIATFTNIVRGDINGDGQLSPLDYVKVKNHIMETNVITDNILKKAADANMDNSISPLDYIRIKNTIMGII